MRSFVVKVTDQLWTDLKRGARSRKMSVAQFAAFRLQIDRYDLITEELLAEGHVSKGRMSNETVL